jgi:type I restriction enzyme S subunit
VKIPLPPRSEQERIVTAIEEAFARIDAGVAGLQRVRRQLEILRNSALKALSNDGGQWVKLGEIAEVVGGVTKDTKRQTDPSYVEVPYLRVANVQRGYLDLGVLTTIRVPASTVERLRLEPDDILFNEGGDRDKLGRGWVWEGQVPNCIHQNHVFRARLHTDEFDPKFVSMHGNTFGRAWFETMGKQTTNLASVSLTTLKAFPVPKIPIDEQRRLVEQVEAQTSQIENFQRIVGVAGRRAAALRSAILARAFAGRLAPQDSDEEPASILLDQIASEGGSSNSRGMVVGSRKTRTIHQEGTP